MGMEKQYVEKREGDYWVKDMCVPLDSIVYEFNRGECPQSRFAARFPS